MFKVVIAIVLYGIIILLAYAVIHTLVLLITKKSKDGDLIKFTLSLICLILIGAPFFLMFRGVYCISNISVGECEDLGNMSNYLMENTNIKFGVNIYGEPILINPTRAFKQMAKYCPELVDEIEDEYDIKFTPMNYPRFKEVYLNHNYSDPEAAKQKYKMYDFLKIYQNNLKRVFYIVPEGWERNPSWVGYP